MLRISLEGAKMGTDMALVKLYVYFPNLEFADTDGISPNRYIVTLTFLPINILTGLFSTNSEVPHNGDRDDHLRADGSFSPFNVFGIIIGGVMVCAVTIWVMIWLIFKTSKNCQKRRGPALS